LRENPIEVKGETFVSSIEEQFILIVDGSELANILAALRFHQGENLRGSSDIPD
jgi:hypothetical protein